MSTVYVADLSKSFTEAAKREARNAPEIDAPPWEAQILQRKVTKIIEYRLTILQTTLPHGIS